MTQHIFGQRNPETVRVKNLDIKKLQTDLSKRMAEQIEFAIRTWIEKSEEERLKALLATVIVKEKMIKEISDTLNQAVSCLYDICDAETDHGKDNQIKNAKNFLNQLADQIKK